MRAFIVDRYGPREELRSGDMPCPELRDDDVLVEVHAAGVNPLDGKIRSGEFKLILPYRLPLILGNDVAGTVVRVGPRVRLFKPGDQVYARPHHDRIGTFADFIAMKEEDVALKPESLTMEAAANRMLLPAPGSSGAVEGLRKQDVADRDGIGSDEGNGGVGAGVEVARAL